MAKRNHPTISDGLGHALLVSQPAKLAGVANQLQAGLVVGLTARPSARLPAQPLARPSARPLMGTRFGSPITSASSPRVRRQIALVSTDELSVAGLTAILGGSAEPDSKNTDSENFEVVSLSVSGALRSGAIRIVLIDAASTDHLFELIAAFRRTRPTLRLIILAGPGDGTDAAYIERVIGAGAKGVLAVTATAEELRLALRIVEDGSIWAPRKVLSRLLDARSINRQPAGASESVRFTLRESQVIRLVVEGRSNREIGDSLGIDAGSVKAHLGRIMRKVGASNRIELTMYALNQHLVQGE